MPGVVKSITTVNGLVQAMTGGSVETADLDATLQSAVAAIAGKLAAASNLSDLANAATARTNLGVPAGSGTSTGTNTGDQFTSITALSVLGNASAAANPAAAISAVNGSGFGFFVFNDAANLLTFIQTPYDGMFLTSGTGGAGGVADAATARGLLGLGTAALLDSDTDGTLAANSDTRLATQKAVKTYVDTAVTGLLDFKGNLDASANPNYPAASKGDAYYVSVAGKVGGASGKSVDVGDVVIAKADNAGGTEASVGTSWFVIEHNLVGALLASNNLSDVASASTARTNLGLAIGTNVQAFDATLAALAAADWVLNSVPIGSGADTVAQVNFAANTFPARASTGNLVAKAITDFGLSLVDDADAATARTTLGLSGLAVATLLPANVVDNGNFDIWQRGTSFASIATGAFGPDRWKYIKVGAMVHTLSQSTDVPTVAQSGVFSNYSLKLAVTTVDSSIAAGDICAIQHYIEGYDFCAIAQRAFTVSFWVKSFKTGTFCLTCGNAAGDRGYAAEYTISASNTWEYKTITFTASPSAGTWNYTNGGGLVMTFAQAVGSTFQTTANAWNTGNFAGTANQVNNCDSTSNTFFLSQVQVNAGSTAYPIQPRPFEVELGKCQRYYESSFYPATTPPTSGNLNGVLGGFGLNGAAAVLLPFAYKVQKRATPTVTTYDGAGTSGKISYYTGPAGWINNATPTAVQVTTYGGYFQMNASDIWLIQAEYTASADL